MHRRAATTSLLLVFAACFMSFAGSPSVARADTPSRFDIPAEPLDQALRDLAIQAKYNISYEPSAVRGLHAPAIQGEYTTTDVLSMLLKGTRLHAVHVKDNTVQVLDDSKSPSTTTKRRDSSNSSVVHLAYADATPAASSSVLPAADPSLSANDNTPGKDLEEIVVTGTNIRGVDNKTVPLLVFDRADIDRSGYATTQDFIGSLPQNVKSGANSADGILAGGQGINNAENSTAANLRGLGANSTLTLLNGHRIAPVSFGTGVDLSMIPLSAVERIEVLTDGSSAVYGSDAVGGVVNIILRHDFDGAETSARFETLSRGGGEQKQIGQSLGRSWDSGSLLTVLQFQDANAIHSEQRDFTENLPRPTDIYPDSKRYSGVLSAHQSLPAALELFTDVLAEHDNGFRAFNSGGNSAQVQLESNTTNSVSANVGLRWQPFGDWRVETSALFSQASTLERVDYNPPGYGYTNGTPYLREFSSIKEGDLKLDGTLFRVGDSSIKAAAGASYRREEYSQLYPYNGTNIPTDRHVTSVYAELYAPLITPASALPFLNKLEISAAARRDSYSDFGASTNPRIGVFWSPVEAIGIRASFSTSFRAPNPFETISDVYSTAAFVEPGFPLPNGTTGNALFYGNQILGPETSHNLSLGLDYQPAILQSTHLSLNYYRIRYTNRIISAPFNHSLFISPQVYGPLIKQFPDDAAIAAFMAGLEPPQMLYDFSPEGTGLAGVRFAFPYGEVNAAKEFTEGFDLGTHSLLTLSSTDKLVVDVNATYIRTIDTTYCSACIATDLINTYRNPLKLRLRGAGGWSNDTWSVNAAVNFANAYTDTNVLPEGRIGSFTTLDANANYRLPWKLPTTIGLAVANVFNTNPPRTAPALNAVEYDPTNADPRGRSLALQIRSQW